MEGMNQMAFELACNYDMYDISLSILGHTRGSFVVCVLVSVASSSFVRALFCSGFDSSVATQAKIQLSLHLGLCDSLLNKLYHTQ